MQGKNVLVIENQLTGHKEVQTLVRESGQKLKIKVRSGHRYMLYQQTLEEPLASLETVKKLRLQKQGKNLKLLLDDEPVSEVLLEDYYTAIQDANSGLYGRDVDGKLLRYITTQGEASLDVGALIDGQAPSFYELAAPVAAPAIATAAFAFGPWAGVAAGAAVAAAASSGKNDSTVTGAAASGTDTTAPAAPTVRLSCDSGSDGSDKITKNGAIDVQNVENGATVQYSTDGGTSWSTTFTAQSGLNNVKVRVVDAAKNASSATDYSFTLDTTGPVAPTVSLQCDTGTPSDKITSNGALSVTNVEAGASVLIH
ncbi:hypothetical protein [Limnohabitans sp.]